MKRKSSSVHWITFILLLFRFLVVHDKKDSRKMNSKEILFVFLLPFASSKMVNIDLTYPFDENTVYWPTEQKLRKFKFTSKHAEVNTSFETYYEANRFSAAEHGGTHLDAPRHFVHGKLGVANISLEKLIGRLFLVDVSLEVDKNKDFLIMPEHIEQAETSLKRKVDDHIVLFYTGELDVATSFPGYFAVMMNLGALCDNDSMKETLGTKMLNFVVSQTSSESG